MYHVRRRERDRPWAWKDQEAAFAELVERIEWVRDLGACVDLRALATRSNINDHFAFTYVNAHVRLFDCDDKSMEDTPLSFRYPTAWFEREVLSIDDFLTRIERARISQAARLRSGERALEPLRVGRLEAHLQTDGDTQAFSNAGYSRAALHPTWSWWVRLVSAQATTPLVSYSSDAPFFETALDLIENFGGMKWFRSGDIRVDGFNIVVSDPRGVIVGVEQGTTPGTVLLKLTGQRLDELRVSVRWRGQQSAGTHSTVATQEVELPAMQGPVSLNAALVAKHDELVDVANFELVPAPSMPQILELIRRGETALVEFKEWIRLGDQKIHNLEKCVVAMANGSETGVILLGVDDCGEMKWGDFLYKLVADDESFPNQFGRRCAAAERYGARLRDELLTKISPGPVIDVQVVGCEPDVVLRMDVYPSPVWVHDREERIWVRRNASVRSPNNTELDAKRGSR